MFVPTDSKGRTRLLPASLPYRFFIAACLFHIVAWSLVAAEPARVLAHRGGLGPGLGALHALTLGTLAMTAIGASLQLLPVATVQAVRSVRAVAIVWWLFAPGTALLVGGFVGIEPGAAAVGALLVGAGLAVYAALLAANLAGAKRQRALTLFGWAGLAGLLAVVATGPLLAAAPAFGVAVPLRGLAVAHLLVATYGFVGMFAVGFAYLLVPMFLVARAPAEGAQRAVLAAFAGALAVAVAGILLEAGPWPSAAAAAIAGGAGVAHAVQMTGVLRRRRSRDTNPALPMMVASWIALPVATAVGALAAFGVATQVTGPLFVVLLVVGWLLSLMLAVLLRILPFLASVHVKVRAGRLPLVSSLTPAVAARALAATHLAALAALVAGVLRSDAAIVRSAGVAGVLAAIVLFAFLAGVAQRARAAVRAAGDRDPPGRGETAIR